MNKHIIRQAVPADLAGIVQLCQQHAAYEKVAYVVEGKEKHLKQYLFAESPVVQCLVVEKNDQLIGYATFMKQFSTWNAVYYLYLDCLYLKQNHRGVGIGNEIMNRVRQYAMNQHLSYVEWQTPVDNKKAIEFYQKIGAITKAKERFYMKVA